MSYKAILVSKKGFKYQSARLGFKESRLRLEDLDTPFHLCEERLLEDNLKLLLYVKEQSGAKILLALKGFALKSTAKLVSQYLDGCCCTWAL